MNRRQNFAIATIFAGACGVYFHSTPTVSAATPYTLIGWCDLGMNFQDSDYSVFAILPPSNTIHAQLIDASGKLVKSGGNVQVTYEAVADASGSINTSSAQKTNFWNFVKPLFGVDAAPVMGLRGNGMMGSGNTPQPMTFDPAYNWFGAEGIPLTNYDDSFNHNPYPMLRLVARDGSGNILASTRIVAPVSDETECRTCHKSGVDTIAIPLAGWVYDSNPDRDYKLNILLKHDDRQHRSQAYADALQALGYSANGLYATAMSGTPVLCAKCHASNTLRLPGIAGIPSLSSSMHSWHGNEIDPQTGAVLGDETNRAACYQCHPGPATRFLRGAMGKSVAADGTMAIQCQNCHGTMSAIGDPARQSWLAEPTCQSCHRGDAASTKGQLRNTTALDAPGNTVQPADLTFATTPNQPSAGLSLFRLSSGHGALMCEACHGSTHAESPSSNSSDNQQNIDIQGFAGPLGECTACHRAGITSTNGGPHGMHAVGAGWVSRHSDVAERNASACASCHGADYRGTVLSQAFTARTLAGRSGATIQMWRGYQVSCYTCHNGPGGSGSAQPAAVVNDSSATTVSGQAVTLSIQSSLAGTLRIVSQPSGGTAAIAGSTITYRAAADFEGTDTITYAMLNNGRDSNLGTATIRVTAGSRPTFSAASIANAASYASGTVAPGMLIAVFGAGLGPTQLEPLRLISGGYVQKSLAGSRILFDGVAAPLLYVSAGQAAAAVPYSVAGKASTSVVIETNGIRSNAVNVPVVAARPGIFTSDASGKGPAKALNQDYSVNTAANPAKAGDVITIYATGEGMVTPDAVDGKLSVAPLSKPAQAVTATIGGLPATVQFAGPAPGLMAGLMQVNLTTPSGLAPGAAEVIIAVGGASSQTGVTVQMQ